MTKQPSSSPDSSRSLFFLSRCLLLRRGQSASGFTILESLLAIVVVMILLVSVAPVLTLAVATRVQARRMEMATQAARTYLDALRSGVVPTDNQPAISLTASTGADRAAPTSPTDATIEACVDRAGNLSYRATASACPTNSLFIVQAQGYNPASTDLSQGYQVAVRVYRAAACTSSTSCNLSRASVRKAQSSFTGNTGVAPLGAANASLVEMVTDIPASATFDNFCKRLGGC